MFNSLVNCLASLHVVPIEHQVAYREWSLSHALRGNCNNRKKLNYFDHSCSWWKVQGKVLESLSNFSLNGYESFYKILLAT